MIKVNKGRVEVCGSATILIAELSMIVNSLHEDLSKAVGADGSKEIIMKAVEVGFMSEDELKVKNKKCVSKAELELVEALDELKELIMKGMMKNGSK